MSSTPLKPPVIGIVGGIGSGKSTVADALHDQGCIVTDSDRDGRVALRDPAVRDTLVAWWGTDILNDDDAVDRAAVARIVFTDPRQRRRLEALTHPLIEARRRAQWAEASADTPAFVIDAPLLLEAGLDTQCDAIIFVHADRGTRLRRVVQRRGWSESELKRREESQMPLDAKRARADYVVENNGDLERLSDEVRRILSEIIRSHRERARN